MATTLASFPVAPQLPDLEPALGQVYLARHGETESNLERRYAGYSAEPLTETGRSQMGGLAAQLGRCGIAEIWTSAVARARESAHLVSQMLRAPVRVDSRLNELRMGPWEGLTEAQVADRFPDAYALWCTLPDRLVLDGRETLEAVAARVTAAMRDAASRPGPVLLMTHVAPLRVAVLHTLGLPLRLYKLVHVSNGACVRVDRRQCEVYPLSEEQSLRHRLNLALSGPESSAA
ncbi:MAG TPA: histidine phosphatase family protein [Gemmatimonadales bacterium]|jgi:probable phosphoglycerate mutase|nr:histidine phosphatase family protein [Gemmatimonadales bacterium]